MSLSISQKNENFSFCGQISTADIEQIKSLGFKTVINNRPDNEGGELQPKSSALKAMAEATGLSYAYIPVIPSNMTEQNISQYQAVINSSPMPILGFCRTGSRAATLYESASNSQLGSGAIESKQSIGFISDFFKNKCLATKLLRKFSLIK